MDGEFFDRIDIRHEDFICRASSSVCSFSTIPWKQGRRNERRRDERRENDEKWTVTRIPFSRSDTYTSTRMKASTKIVTSRFSLFFFPSSPTSARPRLLLLLLLPSVPPSLLLLYPDVHGKDIHRHRRWTVQTRRGSVGQRHNRTATSNRQQRG